MPHPGDRHRRGLPILVDVVVASRLRPTNRLHYDSYWNQSSVEFLGDNGDDFLTGDYPNTELDLGAGPGVDPHPNSDVCDGGNGANVVVNCED